MDRLARYLADVSAKPFARGEADCCIFVADWVLAVTGKDPAAGLRGYSTDQGAMLRIGRAGGFLALAEGAMAAADMRRVETPERGDVAVLKLGDRLTFAIRAAAGWAVKETDGLVITPQGVAVAIWRA